MCASILILSFSQLVQAQNSDKVDLETYNAQLLNNIDEIPVSDAETPRELSDEVIGQSIASSTSSAISFAELNEENKAIESKSSSERPIRTFSEPNRYLRGKKCRTEQIPILTDPTDICRYCHQ